MTNDRRASFASSLGPRELINQNGLEGKQFNRKHRMKERKCAFDTATHTHTHMKTKEDSLPHELQVCDGPHSRSSPPADRLQ